MKRRLFNLTTAMLLVLCVAVSALWVRSYTSCDTVGYSRAGVTGTNNFVRIVSLSSEAGTLVYRSTKKWPFGFYQSSVDAMADAKGWTYTVTPAALDGMGWFPRRHRIGQALSYTEVGDAWLIPFWIPVMVSGSGAVVLLRASVQARLLQRSGRCRTCGYDLRATPASCPECGTVNSAYSPGGDRKP
jgi:phage FluMu protein Com